MSPKKRSLSSSQRKRRRRSSADDDDIHPPNQENDNNNNNNNSTIQKKKESTSDDHQLKLFPSDAEEDDDDNILNRPDHQTTANTQHDHQHNHKEFFSAEEDQKNSNNAFHENQQAARDFKRGKKKREFTHKEGNENAAAAVVGYRDIKRNRKNKNDSLFPEESFFVDEKDGDIDNNYINEFDEDMWEQLTETLQPSLAIFNVENNNNNNMDDDLNNNNTNLVAGRKDRQNFANIARQNKSPRTTVREEERNHWFVQNSTGQAETQKQQQQVTSPPSLLTRGKLEQLAATYYYDRIGPGLTANYLRNNAIHDPRLAKMRFGGPSRSQQKTAVTTTAAVPPSSSSKSKHESREMDYDPLEVEKEMKQQNRERRNKMFLSRLRKLERQILTDVSNNNDYGNGNDHEEPNHNQESPQTGSNNNSNTGNSSSTTQHHHHHHHQSPPSSSSYPTKTTKRGDSNILAGIDEEDLDKIREASFIRTSEWFKPSLLVPQIYIDKIFRPVVQTGDTFSELIVKSCVCMGFLASQGFLWAAVALFVVSTFFYDDEETGTESLDDPRSIALIIFGVNFVTVFLLYNILYVLMRFYAQVMKKWIGVMYHYSIAFNVFFVTFCNPRSGFWALAGLELIAAYPILCYSPSREMKTPLIIMSIVYFIAMFNTTFVSPEASLHYEQSLNTTTTTSTTSSEEKVFLFALPHFHEGIEAEYLVYVIYCFTIVIFMLSLLTQVRFAVGVEISSASKRRAVGKKLLAALDEKQREEGELNDDRFLQDFNQMLAQLETLAFHQHQQQQRGQNEDAKDVAVKNDDENKQAKSDSQTSALTTVSATSAQNGEMFIIVRYILQTCVVYSRFTPFNIISSLAENQQQQQQQQQRSKTKTKRKHHVVNRVKALKQVEKQAATTTKNNDDEHNDNDHDDHHQNEDIIVHLQISNLDALQDLIENEGFGHHTKILAATEHAISSYVASVMSIFNSQVQRHGGVAVEVGEGLSAEGFAAVWFNRCNAARDDEKESPENHRDDGDETCRALLAALNVFSQVRDVANFVFAENCSSTILQKVAQKRFEKQQEEFGEHMTLVQVEKFGDSEQQQQRNGGDSRDGGECPFLPKERPSLDDDGEHDANTNNVCSSAVVPLEDALNDGKLLSQTIDLDDDDVKRLLLLSQSGAMNSITTSLTRDGTQAAPAATAASFSGLGEKFDTEEAEYSARGSLVHNNKNHITASTRSSFGFHNNNNNIVSQRASRDQALIAKSLLGLRNSQTSETRNIENEREVPGVFGSALFSGREEAIDAERQKKSRRSDNKDNNQESTPKQQQQNEPLSDEVQDNNKMNPQAMIDELLDQVLPRVVIGITKGKAEVNVLSYCCRDQSSTEEGAANAAGSSLSAGAELPALQPTNTTTITSTSQDQRNSNAAAPAARRSELWNSNVTMNTSGGSLSTVSLVGQQQPPINTRDDLARLRKALWLRDGCRGRRASGGFLAGPVRRAEGLAKNARLIFPSSFGRAGGIAVSGEVLVKQHVFFLTRKLGIVETKNEDDTNKKSSSSNDLHQLIGAFGEDFEKSDDALVSTSFSQLPVYLRFSRAGYSSLSTRTNKQQNYRDIEEDVKINDDDEADNNNSNTNDDDQTKQDSSPFCLSVLVAALNQTYDLLLLGQTSSQDDGIASSPPSATLDRIFDAVTKLRRFIQEDFEEIPRMDEHMNSNDFNQQHHHQSSIFKY